MLHNLYVLVLFVCFAKLPVFAFLQFVGSSLIFLFPTAYFLLQGPALVFLVRPFPPGYPLLGDPFPGFLILPLDILIKGHLFLLLHVLNLILLYFAINIVLVIPSLSALIVLCFLHSLPGLFLSAALPFHIPFAACPLFGLILQFRGASLKDSHYF